MSPDRASRFRSVALLPSPGNGKNNMNLDALMERIAVLQGEQVCSLTAGTSVVNNDGNAINAHFTCDDVLEFDGLWIADAVEPYGWGLQLGDCLGYREGRLRYANLQGRVTGAIKTQELINPKGSGRSAQTFQVLVKIRDLLAPLTDIDAREVYGTICKFVDAAKARPNGTLTVHACPRPRRSPPGAIRHEIATALEENDVESHCRVVIGNTGIRIRDGQVCHAEQVQGAYQHFLGGIWIGVQQGLPVWKLGTEGFGIRLDKARLRDLLPTAGAVSSGQSNMLVSDFLGNDTSPLAKILGVIANAPEKFKRVLSQARWRCEEWLDPKKLDRSGQCTVYARYLA